MHMFEFIRELCENHRKIPEGTSKNLCRIILASPDTNIEIKTFPTGNSIDTDARKWRRGLDQLFFNEEGGGGSGVIVEITVVVILIALIIFACFCYREHRKRRERESKEAKRVGMFT